MITEAILHDGNRQGTSRYAIAKYIAANYPVDEAVEKVQIRLALRRMTQPTVNDKPDLVQVKGSFKLAPDYKKQVTKKTVPKKKKSSQDKKSSKKTKKSSDEKKSPKTTRTKKNSETKKTSKKDDTIEKTKKTTKKRDTKKTAAATPKKTETKAIKRRSLVVTAPRKMVKRKTRNSLKAI